MMRSESKRLLLSDDYNDIWKSETEGFSSGYESPMEYSEAEIEKEVTNNTCKQIEKEVEDKRREVMHFENTNALCEQLKYILNMPELCDVTFLVGPNKVPVYGVKAILGTRSRVMYKLILDRQREMENRRRSISKKSSTRKSSKLLVDVKKYDSEDFRKIIQFIHCGSVEITLANVTGLLCGACQFGLDDLKVACWDFIGRCLTHDSSNYSAITLLDCGRQYSQHTVGNKLMSKLCSFLKRRSTCVTPSPVGNTEKNSPLKTSRDSRSRTGSITTTV